MASTPPKEGRGGGAREDILVWDATWWSSDCTSCILRFLAFTPPFWSMFAPPLALLKQRLGGAPVGFVVSACGCRRQWLPRAG